MEEEEREKGIGKDQQEEDRAPPHATFWIEGMDPTADERFDG